MLRFFMFCQTRRSINENLYGLLFDDENLICKGIVYFTGNGH